MTAARLLPATPTRLATWVDCPRRYRLQYLEHRPGGPAWAHISWGTSVHAALRDWWDLPVPDRRPERAGDLIEAGWVSAGYRDRAQETRWHSQAVRVVTAYLAGLDPAAQPRGIERTVGTTTPRLTLSGRVDRIDERVDAAGREVLAVVDYKTGRRVPGTDDVRGSLALAVYAACTARVLRRPCHRVELHHVPSGAVVGWDHTDASLARHLARADDIGADLAVAHTAWTTGVDGGPSLAERAAEAGADDDGVRPEADVDRVFPARSGPLCGWCDLRRWCPQGRQAVPAHAAWDGLAEVTPDAGPDG